MYTCYLHCSLVDKCWNETAIRCKKNIQVTQLYPHSGMQWSYFEESISSSSCPFNYQNVLQRVIFLLFGPSGTVSDLLQITTQLYFTGTIASAFLCVFTTITSSGHTSILGSIKACPVWCNEYVKPQCTLSFLDFSLCENWLITLTVWRPILILVLICGLRTSPHA